MSQKVLVTGCSSGFGRLIAEALAYDGHQVFASMRGVEGKNSERAHELNQVAQKNNLSLEVIELDVTSQESIDLAIQSISSPLDIVINNAGRGGGGVTEAYTEEDTQALFNVNLFGVMNLNRAVLPAMRKRKHGLLIHISSILGRLTLPFSGVYNATKFALEGYVESLYYELKPLGVDAVLVEPGAFPTEVGLKLQLPSDKEVLEAYGEWGNTAQKMFANLGHIFAGPDAHDPQLVVQAVQHLINQSAGQRPLRTVVDPYTGEFVEKLNQSNQEQIKDFLNAFHFPHS